jgi:hypothetical protein
MKRDYSSVVLAFVSPSASYFVLLARALVVFFLELAFRPHPVVQVATVNSATLDVNLEGALTDFFWRGCVLS